MVPAPLLLCPDRDKDIETALDRRVGCIVFDLAQTNVGDLPRARQRVAAGVRQARERGETPILYVRINGLQTEQVDADLDAIMPATPHGIVLPHSLGGADVQRLSVKLAVREAQNGQSDGATKIIAMVAGTPAAIFEMSSYRGASQRLTGLIYDGAELASALGITAAAQPPCGATFALARSLTLFAARNANVVAIDAASPSDADEACRTECEAARSEGFSGKLAVELDQVAIIEAVFAEQR